METTRAKEKGEGEKKIMELSGVRGCAWEGELSGLSVNERES